MLTNLHQFTKNTGDKQFNGVLQFEFAKPKKRVMPAKAGIQSK